MSRPAEPEPDTPEPTPPTEPAPEPVEDPTRPPPPISAMGWRRVVLLH